ncbi:MAG: transporter substrate-binding domain-containing protein [Anaerolineae bacterium]|nr:transporter substrate-binding domain-containing protein [Anaerolineae bacterium]
MLRNRRTALLFVTGLLVMALFSGVLIVAGQEPASTLTLVQDRGSLICGVNQELFGFGYLDPDTSEIIGFDVDFCRAFAIAIFGAASPETLQLSPQTAQTRLPALSAGEIDVLVRNTTWTLSRDTDAGLDFGPTNFYDGQSIMVRAGEGLDTWEALDGTTICTTTGTTTEKNITDAMEARGLDYELLQFESTADTNTAFMDGRCDVQTSDRSQLEALRAASPDPSAYFVWDSTFSKEPLGPVYRQNDSAWADVINWTVFLMIEAEEVGINSENVDGFLRMDGESDDDYIARVGAGVARLVDPVLGLGGLLGLENDFMVEVIRQVGNYGEVYERYFALDGPLPIVRGPNELWTNGGLIYSPALR